ncbi:MAG TPA: GNAT family N-acetyltransferase [Terriglobales bacterium]
MGDCAGAVMRLLNVSDIPAAVQLSEEASWNQTGEDWRMLIDLASEGCLAIEVDGELAATTTLLCYGRRLAWIGMVLTRLQYRGRGFARRLLTQALAQADQMGIETVKLDATDQGKPIYEKLGFRSEQAVERWSRPGSVDAPGLRSYAHPSKEWRGADLQVFGADRSQLLERLARRNPPFSVVRSYLFTRPGRQTAYLGPCVSDTSKTARTLIERALQTAGSSGWSWDLFPNNANAVAIAQDLAFAPTRRLLRMVRGKDLQGKEEEIYAIAGFELG